MINTFILMLFPFLMFYCAFTDLFSMTIHNKASLVLIIGFVCVAYLSGMDMQTFLWHWVMFIILISAGIALFAFRFLGAGDGKLIASTGLWLGWGSTPSFLLIATLVGGLLAVLILLFRANLVPAPLYKISWVERLHSQNDIPYGIALSIGAIIVYPQTPWVDEFIRSSFIA